MVLFALGTHFHRQRPKTFWEHHQAIYGDEAVELREDGAVMLSLQPRVGQGSAPLLLDAWVARLVRFFSVFCFLVRPQAVCHGRRRCSRFFGKNSTIG